LDEVGDDYKRLPYATGRSLDTAVSNLIINKQCLYYPSG